MAITALRGIVPEWYVPDSEKDEDQPTRFKLRPLTPPQVESVMEVLPGGAIGVPIRNYSQILKMSVEDWEHFNDPNTGSALKCSFTNHHRIPQDIRIELGAHILEISQMDEETAGN